MYIVRAPHPSLRLKADFVTQVDKKLLNFIKNLGETLIQSSKRGVGLAAPQVDRPLRVFVTYLTPQGDDEGKNRRLQVFINPNLTKHRGPLQSSDNPKSTPLEGCLSIPGLYGPVPRYPEIDLEYQDIVADQLTNKKITLNGFPARLAQHELDHLNGVLFTDYILNQDLPIYHEDNAGQLKEMKDRSILEIF